MGHTVRTSTLTSAVWCRHRDQRSSPCPRREGNACVRVAGLLLALGAALLPAHAEDFAVVTNRVVYPGETLVRQALEEVPVRNGRRDLSAVATEVAQVEGKVARRTLLPSRFIALNALRDSYLVEKGAAVQVFFVQGAMTISITGVSLQPGSAGDLIKIRNVDSGAVISGTVMADGSVRVGAT
jgi:flagella basal body P-ring formation protein FlgA